MADPTLPDAKILRYRSSAVSLSRSSEQCRATLKKIQAERPQADQSNLPICASAPVALPRPQPPKALPLKALPLKPLPPMTAARIETAKAEARDMLTGLARLGAACPPGLGMTAIRLAPDPCGQVAAAVTAAFRDHRNASISLTTR